MHPRHPRKQMRVATFLHSPNNHHFFHSREFELGRNDQRRYLLVILLLSLEGGLGNTVQITLAGLGDAAATLVVVVLEDTDLGERLADLAVNGARGVDVVGGARAAVLGATVDLAETADTDGLAHVDVTGDSGGTDVVPGGDILAEVRHLGP